MKQLLYILASLFLMAICLLACEFNNDAFRGFTQKQVELILAGSNPTVGKNWVRVARLEDGQSVTIECDSSNSLRIRKVAETTTLKDSIYFSYNLLEACNLDSTVQKQGVWRLFPTGDILKVDSLFIFSKDTLRASIEEITPYKLRISYRIKIDSIQDKKVVDVFEQFAGSE